MISKNPPRHFTSLSTLSAATLRALLDDAHRFRTKEKHADDLKDTLTSLVFEKPSTRTRVSFEASILLLGGRTCFLTEFDSQLGRDESMSDTARVLSRYVQLIVLRTGDHGRLEELAEHASVPVINGLTDKEHPCQVIADILTLEANFPETPLDQLTVCWIGEGNNVARSLLHAATQLGMRFRFCAPENYGFDENDLKSARAQGARLELVKEPLEAATGAHAIITDTWHSMADESAQGGKQNAFEGFSVTDRVMKEARADAIFMHCLPAYRNREVTGSVIDGERSRVWDEAENRIYVQQAILRWCMGAF